VKPNFSQWKTLILLTSSIATMSMVFSGLPAVSLLIKEQLQLTSSQLSLLMTSFFAGTMVMSLVYTFYFDRFKVRMLLLIGLGITGTFMVVSGAYLHFVWMTALIALAGLGYGIISPSTNKGIVDWFPQQIRGTAMSLKQVGVMAGSMISSLILPAIALVWGLRGSLLFLGVFAWLIGIISFILYKDREPAVDSVRRLGMRDVLRLFKNPQILRLNAVSMLFTGIQFIYLMFLPLFLGEVFRYDLIFVGFMLSLASVGGGAGRVAWGMVSDFLFKGRRKPVLIVIACLSLLSGAVLAVIPAWTAAPVMGVIVTVYGMTAAGYNGLMHTMTVELADSHLSGVLSGINFAFINFGSIVFPYMIGILLDASGNYRIAWIISAAMALAAAGLMLTIGTEKRASLQTRAPQKPA